MKQHSRTRGTGDKGSRIARRIARKVGRAIGDWDLFTDGDRVLVAVSGGKDSFALLHHLHARRPSAPIDFTLLAAHVRVTPTCGTTAELETLREACRALEIPLHEVETVVRPQSHPRNGPTSGGDSLEGINCHRCATARRQALFRLAREVGAHKLALGHHLDDIVETALLNLLFQGNFSTMRPRQPLFDGRLVVVRPLALVTEAEVLRYVTEEIQMKRHPGDCPVGQKTERARIKALITELSRDHPRVRQSVFAALGNVKRDYLLTGD